MDYIKVEDLKDGYLYRIRARNSGYGIWFGKDQGFTIRRTKFYDVYSFVEIHYDLSKHFGTARPTEELEQSPFLLKEDGEVNFDEKVLLNWLADRIFYYELQSAEDELTNDHDR